MDKPILLIVDDEEKNIKLLKGMLHSENYAIHEALNGETALKKIAEVMPDLILLDVMMPNLNGFEVCQKLKQDKKTRSIPITMVTALKEKEDRLKAMEVGADDFLSKPVDRTELLIRVRSLLRIKQYHDELYKKYLEISEIHAKLKELEEYKEGLLQMIVHDLKNPLFAISANIELLLFKKDSLSATQSSSLENCLDYCYDLNEIIQQLLDVHKIEQGKLKLNREELNVTPLIEELLQQFRPKAEVKKVIVSYSNSNGITSVAADKSLIKRVVANLIDNGIRHTPEGGIVQISSEPIKKLNGLCISVNDSGDGIAPQYHQKIFNKFEQGDLQKKGVAVGTAGLGLAFCKMAVELHGGKIWVESNGSGDGANFCFTIPIE
jgi:signal transduction histidine kinase